MTSKNSPPNCTSLDLEMDLLPSNGENTKSNKKTAQLFEDVEINVKLKLSALWIATMFCYLYADILSFYKPGMIEQIMVGEVLGFQIEGAFLLGSAILMSIPTIMVFLSLILNPEANRYTNIILGIVHIGLAITTMLSPGAGAYYVFYSLVEIVFLSLIVWYAWKWPTQKVSPNNNNKI